MGNLHNSKNKTYITMAGKEIPLEHYTPEFMENMEYFLNKWLEGYSRFPSSDLNEEQMDYILNHLETTSNDSTIEDGHLTRIENGDHFLESGLKEGDMLKGNSLYRSFSRTRAATKGVFQIKGQFYDDIVFYRTNGDTLFFDPTTFSNPYPHQKEVFVPLDKCKIDKITTITDDDELYNFLKKNDYDPDLDVVTSDFKSVTLVDISYVG